MMRSIAGRIEAAARMDLIYQANLETVVGYLLKGGPSPSSAPGLIVGKRAGWTQNIGARARNARKGLH